MVKPPKAKGDKEKAVVLERRYGPYSVKICFAEQSSGTAQNLLDVIMQAYRHRMERAQNLQSDY